MPQRSAKYDEIQSSVSVPGHISHLNKNGGMSDGECLRRFNCNLVFRGQVLLDPTQNILQNRHEVEEFYTTFEVELLNEGQQYPALLGADVPLTGVLHFETAIVGDGPSGFRRTIETRLFDAARPAVRCPLTVQRAPYAIHELDVSALFIENPSKKQLALLHNLGNSSVETILDELGLTIAKQDSDKSPKRNGEIVLRETIREMFCSNGPRDIVSSLKVARTIRQAISQELMAALTPLINYEMKARHHDSLEDKKTLCKWLNQTLRDIGGLAVRCPVTGKPAILIANQGHDPAVGRFQFYVDQHVTKSTGNLPDIQLCLDRPRIESMSDAERARRQSTVGKSVEKK